jgi:hypothetical protein
MHTQRCVLWRSVLEEEQLFSLGERYYPAKWAEKYGGEWRRFLLKAGASHIMWVAAPELSNEQVLVVEKQLISILNPTANRVRPRSSTMLQPITRTVMGCLERQLEKHRHTQ